LSVLGVAILAAGALAAIGQPAGQAGAAGPLPAPTPAPTTVTLDAIADTFVDSANPSTNYGTNPSLYVALGATLAGRVTLARFNLSSIPAGATVQAATFQMNLEVATGLSVVSLTLGRAKTSWTETGVTWISRPDLESLTSASIGSTAGWVSWEARNLVQGWVSKTYSNFGLGVSGPATGSAYSRRFLSRDKLPAPRLVVSYYAPTPTPTRTATRTATQTPVATATPTPTRTATFTPTPTRTATFTVTPTRSATLTPTRPPTKTPTPTPTATRTATPTPTPTPPTCSDPYEPNNTFATATWLDPVIPGGYRAFICTATDTDYFSFGVALRDEIRLTLDELPKNYDLELYDPSNTRVRWSTNPGPAAETISYTASNVGGAFRARVLGAGGQFDASVRYHLRIEIIPFVEPVLIVNSANDLDDGTCNATHCSLREALNAVNAGTAGRVQFSIPVTDAGYFDGVWTIRPSSPLPTMTRRVRIEGRTQTANRGDTNPYGPEIALDGSAAGAATSGIVISGTSSSSVDGIAVCNFGAAGIRGETTTQLTVTGCYIGTTPAGDAAFRNQDGIVVVGGHSPHIGGAASGEGNLISGNLHNGVHLSGTAYALVYGNMIGLKRSGVNETLANGQDGVRLSGGAERCYIGGAGTGEGNVIAGNTSCGVDLDGADVEYNKVLGNFIGTNATGTSGLGNGVDGVRILSGHHNQIGGADAGEGNTIASSRHRGVKIVGGDLNTVAGNRIGERAGFALGNQEDGIRLEGGASYNTIGPSNIIRNSGGHGISLYEWGTAHNTITRNSIGANHGKAIDIGGGVNTANRNVLPPIIAEALADHVSGSSCSNCTVEVFSSDDDEAEVFEGTTTAAFSGAWRWNGSLDRTMARATTTDLDGNTSELTRCVDPFEPNDTLAMAWPIAVNLPTGEAYQGFICSPTDEDYYTFSAEAGTVVVVELNPPAAYRLQLLNASGRVLQEAGDRYDSSLRRVVQTCDVGGDYWVRVASWGTWNTDDYYRLAVGVRPLNAQVGLWLDEGWIGDTEVYKVIPDSDDPANRTFVDVVADVTMDTDTARDVLVRFTVPDDRLGAPVRARRRDCTGCELTSEGVFDLGGGRYQMILNVAPDSTPARAQAVLRFAIPPSVGVRDLAITADVRLNETSPVMDTATAPALHLVSTVPAIIISSRHHLYETIYDREDAATLLGTVTQAAQGPPRGPAGSRRAAIYYVDDYSDLARDWCNESWDPSDEDTANVASRAIDDLLEDWLEDSAGDEEIVILGDDDVIPFYRLKAPCDGTESDHPESDPPALALLTQNDFIGTDNLYADTNHSGWDHGNLELNIGRIIGDNPGQMQRLFENGLAGPSPGTSPRAVLSSCDGPDLDFTGDEGVLDHVRAWGYSASSDMVDNMDWRDTDLLTALGAQFTLWAFSDHANPYDLGTPPEPQTSTGVDGNQVACAFDDVSMLERRPFMGFEGCRIGYSFVSGSFFDYMADHNASGLVGQLGISFHSPDGSEWYTEAVMNMFWRRTMPESGETRSVGTALRRAKADYDPCFWYCWERTAAQQPTLFGVPWLTIPRGDSGARPSLGTMTSVAPLTGTLRAIAANSYEITATLDTSQWSLDRDTAPGFDLVEVSGFEPRQDFGPALPTRVLRYPLPSGAQVTSVDVRGEDAISLGVLNVPAYSPGVYLQGEGTGSSWARASSTLGTIPAHPFAYQVDANPGHQMLELSVVPVVYDTLTGQTTLYRRLAVRITYTTSEGVALLDGGLAASLSVPGEANNGWLDVANTTDATTQVTTVALFRDAAGNEVGRATGGPYSVAPGATSRLAPPLPRVQTEGSYVVELQLLHDGVEVGRESAVADVTTGYISELKTPSILVPGAGGVFSVTYTNLTETAQEVRVGASIHSEWGRLVEPLPSSTISVPPHGNAEVTLTWDARGVSLGRYQVEATATPVGSSARSAWRVVEVRAGRPVRRHLTRS